MIKTYLVMLAAVIVLSPANAESLSPGDWQTATSAAIEAFRQGRFSDAEVHFRAAARIAEESPGLEAQLVRSLTQLGLTLRALGRPAEAEQLHLRAARLAEHVRALDAETRAEPMKHLALLYHELGRYDDAAQWYERVLHLADRALGPDHPMTLSYAGVLAEVAILSGRYPAAEQLYRRVLQSGQARSEVSRAQMAMTRLDLAFTLRVQHRAIEAEALVAEALDILRTDEAAAQRLPARLNGREERFGTRHPGVLLELYHVAALHEAQGRPGQAERFHLRAIGIVESNARLMSPLVVAAFEEFARFLRATGREAEARLQDARAEALRGTEAPRLPR